MIMIEPRIIAIQSVHTRALLKMRSAFYTGLRCDLRRTDDGVRFLKYGSDHDGRIVGINASYADIIDELATREHIPNKKEAKDARRIAKHVAKGNGRNVLRRQKVRVRRDQDA